MAYQFKGKTAIVTGSSRGIGRAIALRLANDGASVVINCEQQLEKANEVVEEIKAKGGKAVAIQADVSNPGEVRRLFDEAEQAFGAPDIVFANAGKTLIKPLLECTEEDFELIMNTNARGVFFTLQEAARRVRNGGRIVAVSSGGTKMFLPGIGLYLGSKGAIEQFARSFSHDSAVADRNITVNILSPGYTDTDMLPKGIHAEAIAAVPFHRVGQPEDVADVAAFLASDDARWVTGQDIGAHGGVA